MTAGRKRCSAHVPGGSMLRPKTCSRWAKSELDGAPYCAQHHPDAKAKRRAEADASALAELNIRRWEWQRQSLALRAYRALRDGDEGAQEDVRAAILAHETSR